MAFVCKGESAIPSSCWTLHCVVATPSHHSCWKVQPPGYSDVPNEEKSQEKQARDKGLPPPEGEVVSTNGQSNQVQLSVAPRGNVPQNIVAKLDV